MGVVMGVPMDGHVNSREFAAHVQTYEAFVRGIVRAVGLIAAVLILLYYFTL